MMHKRPTILKEHDPETDEHSHRVSCLTARIAHVMGLEGGFVSSLEQAARLHDIGKVAVPNRILQKCSVLSADEQAIMRTHTVLGAKILAEGHLPHEYCIPHIQMAEQIACYHHERWDGLGYPTGLAGEEIPLGARIVAVADVFDALVNRRPYKEPWSMDQAIEAICDAAGTQFDPQVVAAFVQVIDESSVPVSLAC
jgi:putative two-component system response regulator